MGTRYTLVNAPAAWANYIESGCVDAEGIDVDACDAWLQELDGTVRVTDSGPFYGYWSGHYCAIRTYVLIREWQNDGGHE